MKRVAKKRKSIILRVVLFGFSLYIILLLGSLQRELISLRRESDLLAAQRDNLNIKISEYENLLQNGTESDFIERAARDKLGYVFSDEQVFIDISGS